MDPAVMPPLPADKQVPSPNVLSSSVVGFSESELLSAITKELQILREEVRELRRFDARMSEIEKRQLLHQEVMDRLTRVLDEQTNPLELTLSHKRRLRRFLKELDLNEKLSQASTSRMYSAMYDDLTQQAMEDASIQPTMRDLVREYIIKAVKNRKDHIRRSSEGGLQKSKGHERSDSDSDRESSSKVSSRPVTDADMPIDPSSSAHQMLGVGMIAGLNDQPSLPMLPESSADTKNIPALKRPRIDSR